MSAQKNEPDPNEGETWVADDTPVDVEGAFEDSEVREVLDKLDRELVGLAPIKTRIREIAALLMVDRLRQNMGLAPATPTLHMSFTGNPGTGKTTVAMRMAEILHRLEFVSKGHLVAVTRDDLVGEYVGHTAPRTKEALKKARGGVLFIDEAYYLHKPENERDYGSEAIETLLQVMENEREDIVVILAGYEDRMERFFQNNPGMRSRVAHHMDFPNYTPDELMEIAALMLEEREYRFSEEAAKTFKEYLERRMQQPHFSNARSVRNALDRARLRQANRLFNGGADGLTKGDLMTIEAEDVRASRVFQETPAGEDVEDGDHGPEEER